MPKPEVSLTQKCQKKLKIFLDFERMIIKLVWCLSKNIIKMLIINTFINHFKIVLLNVSTVLKMDEFQNKKFL